ncbi:MAG: hypothetical protein D6734_11690, partial [Candidatus Schekmanbacteria bacterium]
EKKMKHYKKKIILVCSFILIILLETFILAKNPSFDDALKYKKRGDWENATRTFLALLQKNKNCADCFFHLGEIEENKADYEKAAFYYENAAKINPFFYARLGYCYQTLSKWNNSIESFNKYLKTYPNDIKIMAALGISLRKAGRIKEAEKIFKEILEIKPQNLTSIFNLYIIYSKAGNSKMKEFYYKKYKTVSNLVDSQKVIDNEN